jgi:outer membrane protein assembly factor BamB
MAGRFNAERCRGKPPLDPEVTVAVRWGMLKAAVGGCRALVLGVLGWGLPLLGTDWPQWRGPVRDGHADATEAALNGLPVDPRVAWRLKLGAGWASPVVAGGRVFYLDSQDRREVLHAVAASDGQEAWRAEVDAVMHDEQGPDGPRGTPLVHQGHVYVLSCLGELQCRRVTDGQLVWRTHFQKDFGSPWLGEDSVIPGASEHGYTGSPVLAGGQLIACVGSTNGAGVVAFDPATGAVRWKSQDDLAAYAAPFSTVLDGEPQVICFTVSGMVALAPADGRVLWRVPLKTNYGRNCLTPVVVGDRVVTGSYQSGLLGLQVSRSGSDWTASRVWTNREATMNFASPVAVGGFVYGVGPQKNLVCVEASTGRLAWSQSGYFTSAAGNSFAALIVVGNRLLVTTDGGEVLLIATDSAACRELGRAQVCGRTWSHPAYADGRLYVADGISGAGVLRCVEIFGPR